MRYHKDQILLLAFQISAHIALILMIFYATWNEWLITLFVYFLMGCIGTTVTYHRLLSHKSFNPPVWFKYFGLGCATMSLIGSSIGWVALHRQHHRFTDQPGDPHSPLQKGFLRSQWFLMLEPVNPRYVTDLLRDPVQVLLHKYYFLIHIIYAVILYLINPWSVVYLYLAPAALVWTVGGMINSFNHLIGYRNYNTTDNSKNIPFLGYLFWGEGWHNNHHAEPANPQFGRKWWEFDMGWLIIKTVNTLNRK